MNENVSVAPPVELPKGYPSTYPQPPEANGKYSLDLPDEKELFHEDIRVGKVVYVLSELDGPELAKWFDFDASRSGGRFTDDGKLVGEMNHDKYHATLIAMCLKDKTTGQSLPVSKADAWPSSTKLAVFHRCREVSGLSGVKKAKKD